MEQIGCLTEKSNSADRSADQTEASTPEPPVLRTTAVDIVGLTAYGLSARQDPQQLGLLGGDERQQRLEATLDAIAERFGDDMVHRADDLRGPQEPRLSSDMDFLSGRKEPRQ